MGVIIVVPKRKMLPMQEDTVQPEPFSMPTSVYIPPMNLSNLLIDTSKNWQDFAIENLGAASDNQGAVRKTDLPAAVEFVIDGGETTIAVGEKGHLRLPNWAGTIVSVTMLADQVGSMVVDIWKDTVANFPPTDADSITASAPPTITNDDISLDAVLTGWTKTFVAGDILAFNVDSCTTIQRVTVVLFVTRT